MENEYVSQEQEIFNNTMLEIKSKLDEKHGENKEETDEYKSDFITAISEEMAILIQANEQMKRQLIKPRN